MAFTGTASGLSTLPSDTWREDAACASPDVDPEIFFAAGNSGPAHHSTILAKTVCATCPVKPACLKFVTDFPQEFGVFAGLTPDERRGRRRSGSGRNGGMRWCMRCGGQFHWEPERTYARLCKPCAAGEAVKAERRDRDNRYLTKKRKVLA